MTPAEIAEKINAVRAEQGLPAINARLGLGGQIISGASFAPVMRATPNDGEIETLAGRRRMEAAPHRPGVNRGVRKLILDALKKHPEGLTAKQIEAETGSAYAYVMGRLKLMKRAGEVKDCPPPARPHAGRGKQAMLWRLAPRVCSEPSAQRQSGDVTAPYGAKAARRAGARLKQ